MLKVSDKVEILTTIAELQPRISKDGLQIELTVRQFGTVVRRDGGYVEVRPKNRNWTTECYPCELKKISSEEFKAARNYVRNKNERMVLI